MPVFVLWFCSIIPRALNNSHPAPSTVSSKAYFEPFRQEESKKILRYFTKNVFR